MLIIGSISSGGGGIIVVVFEMCVSFMIVFIISFKIKFSDSSCCCLCFSAGTRRTSETSEPVLTAPFGLLSVQNNGS